MTTRNKKPTSSSTPTGPIRVRAEANVIGLQRGAVVEVERTAFVNALIANGHFTLTDEQPTAEPEQKPDDDGAKDSA